MNLAPYLHLRDGNDLEPMDERHVQMIHAVLVSEQPIKVVNIGVANGFSSMASVEAFKSKDVQEVHFVDVNIRGCFTKLVDSNEKLCFMEQDSKNYPYHSDCWIIDGEHKEGAVLDYENARARKAKIIIAHDTNPEWAKDVQWGAIEIGKRMRETATCYFEDWIDRKNEHTKRGLTIAFYYSPKTKTMQQLQELAR